ncbi:hypothetical protein ZIOFF_041314 [Zingiber officinale]|uniref:SET domain-containing protein n=1 Tax=Zingiber officinale TaxID=94328 RepID=A0A8J5GBB4_ZINOF|nr:hypothetical protein ZIOFF_041314 [Zingiber officinale]
MPIGLNLGLIDQVGRRRILSSAKNILGNSLRTVSSMLLIVRSSTLGPDSLASTDCTSCCSSLMKSMAPPMIEAWTLRCSFICLLLGASLPSSLELRVQSVLRLDGPQYILQIKSMSVGVLLTSPSDYWDNFGLRETNCSLTRAVLLSRTFGTRVEIRENEEHFGNRCKLREAYGIYPNASFFNHDCLPNACRFDYVDQARENNTDIVVRAIHDIPVGREVCLSYFPVTWRYLERQTRLMEDYGFRCECDRCVVEKDWSDDDDEDGEEKEDEDEEGMEEEDEAMENMDTTGEDGEDGNFPHAYFFVRYVCDRENCGGTLAPLPPTADGSPSNLMECNVCGMLKTEDNNQQDRQKCSNGSMLH